MIMSLHCTGLRENAYLQKRHGEIVKFMGAGELVSVLQIQLKRNFYYMLAHLMHNH
jgi:hypothetical protein